MPGQREEGEGLALVWGPSEGFEVGGDIVNLCLSEATGCVWGAGRDVEEGPCPVGRSLESCQGGWWEEGVWWGLAVTV